MSQHSDELGTLPIPKLIIKQALPAAMGFLVMSIYGIVDTYFVGNYVGKLGIGAISVVMPISFLMSSVGMAIGIGGASIISRALGSDNQAKAEKTFGNQVGFTLLLSTLFVVLGKIFDKEILQQFGAQGDILPFAMEYYNIILLGVPFLAWAMMSNNVIRAEGKSKVAMLVLAVPAVVNIILDPIFIAVFDWGIAGAAWATTLAYIGSALFSLQFFLRGKSELKIKQSDFKLSSPIIKEIFSIGGVTVARQGTISLMAAVLNQTLFDYGGEDAVAVFGIINRLILFILFPVIGLMQGFMPIAGFNHGAGNWARVKEAINKTLLYSFLVSCVLTAVVMFSSEALARLFIKDENIIAQTPYAMRVVFLATPIIGIQLIGSGYFQAIGKVKPALLLSLSKQGIFLIPLVYALPHFIGLDGAYWSFPIADCLAMLLSLLFLREVNQEINAKLGESKQ